MKKTLIPTFVLGSLLAAQAQFTPGDLAVLQVGTGSGALSSVGTAFSIDEFNTTVVGQTATPFVTIPSDGTGLVLSGTATSEGALSLSPDGSILTFGGYATTAGTTGVASGTAPREVGFVNAAGQFSVVANSSTAMNGNNIRGATSDGHNYWITGPNGTYYQSSGGSSLQLLTSGANTRVANIINGNLYYSTGSGTRGIYSYSGVPTGTATPTLLFGNGASSSPYDFALNAAGNVAYVADDSSVANGGGIQKWVLSGGVWTLAYTFTFGTGSADGARGLTVDWSGTDAIVYATTTEASANRLIELTDIGSGSTYTTLATAPANTVFRSVDFVPVPTPEPSTFALGGLGLAAMAIFRRNRKG
jgi:hypothetical protein